MSGFTGTTVVRTPGSLTVGTAVMRNVEHRSDAVHDVSGSTRACVTTTSSSSGRSPAADPRRQGLSFTISQGLSSTNGVFAGKPRQRKRSISHKTPKVTRIVCLCAPCPSPFRVLLPTISEARRYHNTTPPNASDSQRPNTTAGEISHHSWHGRAGQASSCGGPGGGDMRGCPQHSAVQ